METLAEGATQHLYRHFDEWDNLLYVGVSLSTIQRLSQHKSHSHWFNNISKITIENFPSREEVLKAERIAIQKEAPLHNIALKKRDFPEGVKFINPWRIYTPPGYSVMFMTPTYQFEKRFTVLPGIVETDSYHHINFPSIWHTTKDANIERGTPFIQVIPYKTDDCNLDYILINY